MDTDTLMRFSYLAILLAAAVGWAMVEFRGRMGAGLRMLLAWGLIVTGLAAGYAIWQDIRGSERGDQIIASNGEIELPRASDGHYYATLEIGDVPVRFVVDTGASGVVLSKQDAERVGFDPESLTYDGEASTANGSVRTASITLDKMTLGPHSDGHIQASVNDGALDISLLGMDYLRLYRIEIDGDQMVLTR